MSCSSENLQSETAEGDRPCAFSPLPQQEEDDSYISSFAIEMPHELRASEDNIEPACAVYTKLAFIALVISYNILTYNLPSPKISLNPNSFAMSNLTIFYSRLAANWEADFTFGCQNCGCNLTSRGDDRAAEIYYDHIKAYVFYDEGDKDVLSTASIEPFNLGSAKEHKKVHVKFGHSGWEGNQPIVRTKVANEIRQQVERGVLHLGVRLDIWVTYRKWGLFWKSSLLGLPDSYCWELLVGVMPETGKGRLILSRPKHCNELYYNS